MKPSAVLLIDLENFYCSREDYCSKSPTGYDRARFGHDLEKLLGFARAMAGGLPFTVRRAYANFNAVRYSGGPPQYYLRNIPDELMRQGVEPVQVFRLSQSSSKNAADMRMAMDATALLKGAGSVEHFILVTGDADFIPVILELKRHGHTVSVIGVSGATNGLIQRFVDNFELFEELLAADEVESRSADPARLPNGLGTVVAAIQQLLIRVRPLQVSAIKPLLSKELGHAFDPGHFGCDTTGEFLRKYQNELGIVIHPTFQDQEIDLPGSSPSSNGSTGVKRPVARQPEKPKPEPTPTVPHSREHYVQLLTGRGQPASAAGTVRVPAVPWPVLVWGCNAMVNLLAPPQGGPTHTTSLLPKLIKAAEGVPIPDVVKHLRALYPILRAGLPVQSADGVYALPADSTGVQIRRSVLSYIGYVLSTRLAENCISGEIRPESLVAVFDPGAELDSVIAEVTAALTQPAHDPQPEPKPAPAKVSATAEEIHTPASYIKLLKAGGAKGSETEAFKVLPVQWASVQRVCMDAFTLLSPTGQGGPMPREQLHVRLAEAGKELCINRYDQHVRRSLGILRVAGDLIEEGGLISLNPDITTAAELRNRALAFLVQLLQLRLEEREIYDPIRPHVFVAALEAGPLSNGLVEEITPLITWLYQPTEDEPQPHAPASPDSGVVALSPEELPVEAVDVLEPLALIPVDTEPELIEPIEDAYAFDGALPELAVPLEPVASADAEEQHVELTESDPEPLPLDSPSTSSGVIDVAAITSEAVAAAAEQAPPVALPTSSPPLAVPVADWLPDADPVPHNGNHHNNGNSSPPTALPLAKITTPPLPPLPPLPPETA